MTKRLFLIRHAEANTHGAGEKDWDRELTNTGFADSGKMGKKLFDMGLSMEKVISSDAKRAAGTAELLCEQLKYPLSHIIFDREIYEASVRSLLSIVNQTSLNIQSLMIVGHNPVLSYFAEYLTGEALGTIPTAGVVGIDFSISSWEEVSSGNGEFKFLESPRNASY